MKNILFVFSLLLLVSCGNSVGENTMVINGQIKNLKKGTIYLQKMNDTIMVTVDSIQLNGTGVFTLSDEIESPEMYFLSLDKSPEKNVSFFGEKGVITIDTKLDKFFYAASIQGLENQQLLTKYEEMNKRFNSENLDLIKKQFDASQSGDSIQLDSVQNAMISLVKRRFRYTTQYAINNADKPLAPYLALRDLDDANVKLMDTVNNSLTPEIKATKYGKKLASIIEELKGR